MQVQCRDLGRTVVRTKDIAGPLQVFAISRAETKAAVQARAGAEARLGRVEGNLEGHCCSRSHRNL